MRSIERPWLIQRLQEPMRVPENANPILKAMAAGAAGPFSFGGGYVRGGLTEEANKILGEIFSFDYMGSAEFEFGAVPKALSELVKDQKDLVAFEMTVDMEDVEPNLRRKYPRLNSKGKKEILPERPKGTKPVYVLCRRGHLDAVTNTVRALAKGESVFGLKEYCGLSEALDPLEKSGRLAVGWLEIDNGYFFFTDKEMFKKTALLFTGKEWV